MEGTNNGTAANVATEPRVVSTSLSSAFSAGESGGEERTAGFDDIFAPPETVPVPAELSDDKNPPTGTEEPPAPPAKEEEEQNAEDVIQALAAEHGLDPANAKHRALLDRMASEQGAPGQQQSGVQQRPDEDDDEGITDFEKTLLAPDQPDPNQQQPVLQGQALPPGKFGDILDDTTTALQAWERYRDAWTPDANDQLDLQKANSVMNAIWIRQFAAMGAPVVQNIVNAVLQDQLGEAVQYMRQFREGERKQEIYANVLQELRKQPGYEQLDELFKPLSEKTIKVRKHEVADTRMNRILRNYPWILDVQRHHENPEKALKLTHAARLRAVVRQDKKSRDSVPGTTAKQLVAAGAQIEQKKQSDVARQRINAGPGATGAGSPGGKDENDRWMDGILSAGGGRTISVGQMLRGK